ncbi:hypothetical protein J14TS2_52190 [Bacillus sp. J14TS2]|uniref:hypothetical protein n=1 Tax=Bacillus sp. J14TS2 TaxID=2807188 RepID=UPI001B2DF198|nr:hypothetical protein [Bacillus sp. J14TS2]GIN74744.1 hypothetical protein J14TS2_52190 [Bacillus sp. J14TS2]
MFILGQKVQIADATKTKIDKFIESYSLTIMETSNFKGEITKIEDGIHFVGFKNDLGRVTQGFKADEIKEVK